MRASILGLMMLAAVAGGAAAVAQTPPSTETTHSTAKKPAVKNPAGKLAPAQKSGGKTTTKKTPTSEKTPTSKKTVVKKVTLRKPGAKAPIVAPRHGGAVRRPVHPTASVAAPKLVAKPVVKAPAKPAAPPRPQIPADEGTVTHMHLPRFASLKTDDVNMRSGPGARYPVLWVYKRRELPVKIEREFDIWRLVEDMDGIKGWVHQATLTGKRTFVITGTDPHTLRATADAGADAVAVLKPGVVGVVRMCDANADWCQVQVGGYRGWLQRGDFWGTLPGEAVAP